MKRQLWAILWGLSTVATVTHAGFHFGLGKAAAKKSADAIIAAAEQAASTSSMIQSSTGTTTASSNSPSSFMVVGPSHTWTNAGPSTFTVTGLDNSGNALVATSDILIDLSLGTYLSYGQSQANGIFCRDVNCAYQITQTTIPTGSSNTSFYYLDHATGTAILTATLNNSFTVRSTATLHTIHERVRWYHVGHPFYYSSPAIGDDGTIYIASSYSLGQNLSYPIYTTSYFLVAYNPTGTVKWETSLGTASFSRGAPAIGPDGTVYVVAETKRCVTTPASSCTSDTNELQAYDSNGALKWRVTVSTHAAEQSIGTLSPSIGSDGTIYVLGDGIHAITSTGTVKWRLFENGTIFSSPAIGSDGTIYSFCKESNSANTVIRAFTSSGTINWISSDVGSYPIAAPALTNNTLYALTNAGGPWSKPTLFSLSTSTGGFNWTYSLDVDAIRSSPAIGPDGTIYFGTKGSPSYFYALNSDGTLKWRHNVSSDTPGVSGTDIYSSPTVGADGTIYLGSEAGALYAFTSTGTVLWQVRNAVMPPVYGSINWSSPVLANDGTLYIGTTYGSFVAFRTDSLGLSTASPWPKFHYNNKNTGLKP